MKERGKKTFPLFLERKKRKGMKASDARDLFTPEVVLDYS